MQESGKSPDNMNIVAADGNELINQFKDSRGARKLASNNTAVFSLSLPSGRYIYGVTEGPSGGPGLVQEPAWRPDYFRNNQKITDTTTLINTIVVIGK